jgi:hypothetical protein
MTDMATRLHLAVSNGTIRKPKADARDKATASARPSRDVASRRTKNRSDCSYNENDMAAIFILGALAIVFVLGILIGLAFR